MVWQKIRPGLHVTGQREDLAMGIAEQILKSNRCTIRMFLSRPERIECYKVRHTGGWESPVFHSLTELCDWVIAHELDIRRMTNASSGSKH